MSLTDLTAAGIRLRPDEAVTLVHQLSLKVISGDVAGVPSPHVIRLSTSGVVSVEGPVAADGRTVGHAAQLLEALLPAADAVAGAQRVPGGLKLVIARALGTLDLPPFPSLEAFADSLSRFADPDPETAVGELALRCLDALERQTLQPSASGAPEKPFDQAGDEAPPTPAGHELTVSDIRRARRATGLRLAIVAERSDIPVGLLRQLEWGYLRNWPPGRTGQLQLARYARATGLDEQIVVATLAPLIVEQRGATAAALVHLPARPVAETNPARLAQSAPAATPAPVVANLARSRRVRPRAGALAVAAAALVLLLLPFWWLAAPDRGTAGESDVPAAVTSQVADHASTGPSTGASAEGTTAAADPGQGRRPPPASSGASSAPARAEEGGTAPQPSESMAEPVGSAGTAVFQPASSDGDARLIRADHAPRAALTVLKISDGGATTQHARPSPDGRLIAFDSDRDGVRGVYVASADGTDVRRVSGEGFAAFPSWSPDSRLLAFARAEADDPTVWNLWVFDLADARLRQVTRLDQGQPRGASWFPDSRRLAYGHDGRIIVRNLETDRERQFALPRQGTPLGTPAVSPDGRWIAFDLERDGGWLLELADGSMRRILDDPTAAELTWAPDGRRLAFHSERSGGWNVWVMAPR